MNQPINELLKVNTSQWCIAPSSITTSGLITFPARAGLIVLCDSERRPIKEEDLEKADMRTENRNWLEPKDKDNTFEIEGDSEGWDDEPLEDI